MISRLTLALGLLLAPAAPCADPRFTGSLEAPGATVNAPGFLTVEPSLGISNGRASYGQDGQLVATRHPDLSVNPQPELELGLLERLQLGVSGQADWSRDNGDGASGFGDTQASLGVALLDEDAEGLAPALRLDLQVTRSRPASTSASTRAGRAPTPRGAAATSPRSGSTPRTRLRWAST